MSDIVERLNERIIFAAAAEGRITDLKLAERLTIERQDAAAEITRLRAEAEAAIGMAMTANAHKNETERLLMAEREEVTRLRVLLGEASEVLKPFAALSPTYDPTLDEDDDPWLERSVAVSAHCVNFSDEDLQVDDFLAASSLLKRIEGSSVAESAVSPQERHTEDGVKLEEG